MSDRPRHYKKLAWRKPSEAAALTGLTAYHLRRLIREGWLRLGKHYRIISNPMASTPRYQIHIERLEQWLATPLEKRTRLEKR